MTNTTAHPPLQVPARDIPVPSTPSVEAQTVLGTPVPSGATWTLADDKATIQAAIDAADQVAGTTGPLLSSIYGTADSGVPASVELIDAEGVPVYVATPEGLDPEDRNVYMFIHGSGIHGGGELARAGARMVAGGLGVRTWVVDFRMPPYHPFPANVDDCLTVYRYLLKDHNPEEIIIGGMSAGANVTLATILRARDEGLPLPAAAVANSPVADFTWSGDTMQTNAHIDVGYDREFLNDILSLIAGDHDRTDPYLSPIFGDYSKGFPPTILTAGTRDFLLSDTVRIHRKLREAGIEADLHVWEAAPHFMFMGMAPEDHERTAEVRRFIIHQWSKAKTNNLEGAK
ncbi:acetyl esterase/lipase [Arthrobacter sp. SLBN-100]|uniref:alpha/beta hydrolase fold domain-containing protein n=1 Tax=Arthrobacter sp. SLBN-100 TaxID=2768450 RepID=UPI00114D6E20|nr:alpha/beta hydrolase fold domain-containing protein [Arthrobacter sp. SLBN-100]TQJ66244.1 acetyl esterase/lipase [Arthrobacter sp. SLBN-100]